MTQLGIQLDIKPLLVALLPNLLFLTLAFYLLVKKQSYRVSFAFLASGR